MIKYPDRKPDKETESMRIWEVGKDEEPDDDNAFKVKYKDTEFSLCGFNLMKHKDTGKVVFAYKIKKYENKMLLYYIDETEEKAKEIAAMFIAMNLKFGLANESQNVMDTLENAYNEFNLSKKVKNDNKK